MTFRPACQWATYRERQTLSYCGVAILAVGRFVVERPALWRLYSGYFAHLHRATWLELLAMARAAHRDLEFTFEPLVEALGPQRALEVVARIVSEAAAQQVPINLRPIIDRFGLDTILDSLTPAERQALKRRLR